MPENHEDRKQKEKHEETYLKREREEPISLFEELRSDEDTGHATNLMFWTIAVAGISAATGYIAAFVHVASDTSTSWDTLMGLEGLAMAALFGGSGIVMLALMLGVKFAHEIEYEGEE